MASSIVKSAAKQLGSLLVEEAKNLYKVGDKIEKLQIELIWMECFLRDADTQQHQEEVIHIWVSQVRDIAYEAEDLVEKYLHEVSHPRQAGILNTLKWITCTLLTCDVYTLHNLGSDIDSLTVKISELTSRLQTYGIQIIHPVAYNSVIREERRTYSHFQEDDMVGLKNNVKEIVDKLVKDDFKVISIIGIGGLGKSTLARKVFLDEDVKTHFKHRCVWVYISKQVERDSVFREILVGLLKDEDAKSKIKDLHIGDLPVKICEILTETKCFLVLDDLWTFSAWDTLKPAFATIGASGSKIMITTRNQALLEHVGLKGFPHFLKPLSDQDSWELLQLKAFPKIQNTENTEATPEDANNSNETTRIVPLNNDMKTKMELGKEMLKHCHGLPLAITALGGILLNKKTSLEWEHVHKNISSYLMTNSGGLLQVLELSYHDLPFYLKPCFLYLANFPEDHEISTQKLYQLWEAEGFLAVSNSDEEVEEGTSSFDIAERYLQELIERSMVQVGRRWATGRIRSCRVHDVMRDMCIKKCRAINFLTVKQCEGLDSEKVSKDFSSIVTKKVRRYTFHVQDVISGNSNSVLHLGEEDQYTRSLLVFGPSQGFPDAKMLKDIRKSFPMLRILYIHQNCTDDADAREVGHLIHLKFLCLGKRQLIHLTSSFWDLKYLVSLDFRGNEDQKIVLPNRFHKMERLIHLYLPYSYDILDGEKLNFKAHQMVTLKNFDLEKCETGDLLQMTRLRVFTISPLYYIDNIDVFKLLIGSPMIQSGLLANSFYLPVTSRMMEKKPAILKQLPRKPHFTKFRMTGEVPNDIGNAIAGGDEDELEEPSNIGNEIAGGVEVFFPSSFTRIRLDKCKLSQEIISALEKLPILEDLRLCGVQTHEKISFSAGSFEHLKTLVFHSLSGLKEWKVEVGALCNLIYLEIKDCDTLDMITQGLPDSIRIQCLSS